MIYFDHAATTPMDARVIETMTQSLRQDFGNSGTRYRIGLDAKKRVDRAQERIADLLQIPSSHRIIFTSGGSESNNLFIKGLCFPDKRVACLGLEHPSITSTLESFAKSGNETLVLAQYREEGRLNRKADSVLRENRVRLLCLSHVNHELGIVIDPQSVDAMLKSGSSSTRLFMDGVQAVGKLKLSAEVWRCTAGYSLSAHKFHGPKGIGMLVYDSKLQLAPLIHGGKQQYGVRAGTLPVPLIVGMESAVKLAVENTEAAQDHLGKLSKYLIQGLQDLSDRSPDLNLRFNSLPVDDVTRQSPAIVNFSFPPVEGEVLLHHLAAKDIFVGLGSACSAHFREPSRILIGIGLSEEEARCSLRISFGTNNTLEEIDLFLREFSSAYETLYPTFFRNPA